MKRPQYTLDVFHFYDVDRVGVNIKCDGVWIGGIDYTPDEAIELANKLMATAEDTNSYRVEFEKAIENLDTECGAK